LLHLLRFHWRLLPEDEARDAVRSLIGIIRERPDAQNRSFEAVLAMVRTRTMASPRLARCGLPSSTQRDAGGLFCAPALDANTNYDLQ
jgi:hypothetical protein